MAQNIEMNYYNGTEYIALRPLGIIDSNSSSSRILKQILHYYGTGTNEIEQSLIYPSPVCIIGTGNYFTFGAFDGNFTVINSFHMGGDNAMVGFVTFEAYVSTNQTIVIRGSSVRTHYPPYFVRFDVPTSNGSITGHVYQDVSNIDWFNGSSLGFTFLILY